MRADSPADVSTALALAVNAGDAHAAAELWSEDATVVAPDGSQTRGREAVRALLQGLIDSGAKMEIDLHTIHATDITAVATGTLILTAPSVNGETPVVSRGDSLVIYNRQADGAWRVAIDFPWGVPTRE